MSTWLTEETPSRSLGLTRVIVGAAALLRALIALPSLVRLTKPETVLFPTVDWFPEPSLPIVLAVITLWIVGAVLLTVGWRVTLSGSVLLFALVAHLLLDAQTYGNHLYLMCWLVLLLVLAESGAGLNWKRTDTTVVRWPTLLIMLQASVVYGFSALTKIHDEFLSGQVLAGVLDGGLVEFPEFLRTPAFLPWMALMVIAVESFVALFLWSSRLRPFAMALGLLLHVGILLLMAPFGELLVFALETLAIYPLFLGYRRLKVSATGAVAKQVKRYDLLRLVDPIEAPHDAVPSATGWHGADAHTRVLERLVPWLWVAPFLRLPGVRALHRRAHRAAEPVSAQYETKAAGSSIVELSPPSP